MTSAEQNPGRLESVLNHIRLWKSGSEDLSTEQAEPQLFVDFLKRSHCEENLDFILSTDQYVGPHGGHSAKESGSSDSELFEAWHRDIYRVFIEADSPRECNLPQDLRLAFEQCARTRAFPSRSHIDAARSHILWLLRDAHSQFLHLQRRCSDQSNCRSLHCNDSAGSISQSSSHTASKASSRSGSALPSHASSRSGSQSGSQPGSLLSSLLASPSASHSGSLHPSQLGMQLGSRPPSRLSSAVFENPSHSPSLSSSPTILSPDVRIINSHPFLDDFAVEEEGESNDGDDDTDHELLANDSPKSSHKNRQPGHTTGARGVRYSAPTSATSFPFPGRVSPLSTRPVDAASVSTITTATVDPAGTADRAVHRASGTSTASSSFSTTTNSSVGFNSMKLKHTGKRLVHKLKFRRSSSGSSGSSLNP
ncbi:LADA_0C08900g1_1 [Lachancea dasiensis]|uniref:LADA_0C08900g1_1 n=1 Tax=Lachancea dasiensis TaxID=1072105 RepID=A0A1G4J073_9SACH|nr:LADA_0C08900g1_1 [Lachancea dasiensis]